MKLAKEAGLQSIEVALKSSATSSAGATIHAGAGLFDQFIPGRACSSKPLETVEGAVLCHIQLSFQLASKNGLSLKPNL